MKLLLERWREYIEEVEERESLGADKDKDNISFVLWAKEGADKVSTDKIEHEGMQIQTADMGDHTRLIGYVEDGSPAGYMALEPLEDGVKVGTLAVGAEYRGQGVAKRMYDHVIQNYNLYSGDSQTPESKGLWNNFLAKKYNVRAIDIETGEEVSDPNMIYTKEGEPPNKVYLSIPRGG
jgi:ribosomal protein S18 acetylase RimI-like enzyme